MKNKNEYLKLVDKLTPKEKMLSNGFHAFLMGGLLGFTGEGIKLLLVNNLQLTNNEATHWVILFYVFLASFLTAIGIYDKLVGRFKAGLLVPITGFAHAITSSVMDYKTDGLITGVGANFFKLSGCVLVYGMGSAFIMALIKVICNV